MSGRLTNRPLSRGRRVSLFISAEVNADGSARYILGFDGGGFTMDMHVNDADIDAIEALLRERRDAERRIAA
jgi:hypothetical protein